MSTGVTSLCRPADNPAPDVGTALHSKPDTSKGPESVQSPEPLAAARRGSASRISPRPQRNAPLRQGRRPRARADGWSRWDSRDPHRPEDCSRPFSPTTRPGG